MTSEVMMGRHRHLFFFWKKYGFSGTGLPSLFGFFSKWLLVMVVGIVPFSMLMQ